MSGDTDDVEIRGEYSILIQLSTYNTYFSAYEKDLRKRSSAVLSAFIGYLCYLPLDAKLITEHVRARRR